VDVAGGAGGLLAAILASAEKLRGTLFDQPSVIEQAKSDIPNTRFKRRAQFRATCFSVGRSGSRLGACEPRPAGPVRDFLVV